MTEHLIFWGDSTEVPPDCTYGRETFQNSPPSTQLFIRMPIGALRQEVRMAAASDPVGRSNKAFEKITQTERGRPSSNRAKSVQDFLLRAWRVSPVPQDHGERVEHPISRVA